MHAYQKSHAYTCIPLYTWIPKITITTHSVCFLRYGVRQTDFLSLWAIFLPFYTPSYPENQNVEKILKTPQDIIILHKCSTKNHDDTMHCSWDMVCDGCNSYFSFWAIFRPFIPLTTQKIKILQKWKKHLEI